MSDAYSSMEKAERVYPEIENLVNESDETLRSYLDINYTNQLPDSFWESAGIKRANRQYNADYLKKHVRYILFDRSKELEDLNKELVILKRKIETKKMQILCGE